MCHPPWRAPAGPAGSPPAGCRVGDRSIQVLDGLGILDCCPHVELNSDIHIRDGDVVAVGDGEVVRASLSGPDDRGGEIAEVGHLVRALDGVEMLGDDGEARLGDEVAGADGVLVVADPLDVIGPLLGREVAHGLSIMVASGEY